MCHAKVTRTPRGGDGSLEFMNQDGSWTADVKQAYEVSEEDAKIFARNLTTATAKGGNDQEGDYIYDFTTVDD